MARTVSLEELREWARQLADVEGDPNITDAELTALANRHLTEVYDALVDAGPADYYAASATVTTEPGVTTYPLEANFRNLLEVYVHESTTERRPLPEMPNLARGRFQPPTTEVTLTVDYIPSAPVLEEDSDTFDGVSGWEELIANMMARDVMAKRESDPGIVMANIARLEMRIRSRARSRNKGSPKRIVDLDEVNYDPWYGWTNGTRLACYRLRGDNLEIYEPLTVLP